MNDLETNTLVTNGLKVDLHIHSCYSRNKDGSLVKDGTEQNIPVLLNKLQEYGIQAFAITDHDVFSYSLYSAFKAFENKFGIKKVFPGVEFSVGFTGDKGLPVQVHVIAIFDDSDQEKLKKIETILGESKYDVEGKMCFSEEAFRGILSRIDLNAVLIAHQKNDPTSDKVKNEDANSVGPERFDEFLSAEYFESFEFKTTTNDMFYNLFKRKENTRYEIVRFITGSDCHQWQGYPRKELAEAKKEKYSFTYLKCLPSFRGLAMALTDDSRISIEDNFFESEGPFLDHFTYSIEGKIITVPLSPGINAIIGDNSVGKSLLLHAANNFKKFEDPSLDLSPKIKSGYQNFLSKKKMTVLPQLGDNLYRFDSQGEIRKRFDSGDDFRQKFIEEKYPAKTLADPYRSKVDEQFEKLYDTIRTVFSHNDELKSLSPFVLNEPDIKANCLSVNRIPKTQKVTMGELETVVKEFSDVKTHLGKLISNPVISDSDKNRLISILADVTTMGNTYAARKDDGARKNAVIDNMNIGIETFNERLKDVQTKDEQRKNVYLQNEKDLVAAIKTLLDLKEKPFDFSFDLPEVEIQYQKNPFGDIVFVNRFKSRIKAINNTYLLGVLSSVLGKGKSIFPISNLTEEALNDALINKNDFPYKHGVDLLKAKIKAKLDDDFSEDKGIIDKGENDLTSSFSSGLNASMYFYLLANDPSGKGIYIVDQPEDDVSQTSIREHIIPRLKRMAFRHQIILITHNPQFVVNLDVDNVVYVTNDSRGFAIKQGALEYCDNGFDILKIVSDTLEGGMESLRKRWKRYEKSIDDYEG
jgi:hypothetical protein